MAAWNVLSSTTTCKGWLQPSCNADMFISAECSIEVCVEYIHDSNPNWRKDVQEEILTEDHIFVCPIR